jgi:hypothetical protein
MIFRFPYPLTFDPSPASTGGPTVVNRGRNDLGTRDFFLSSAPRNRSSATLLSSFGVDAGNPRNTGFGNPHEGSVLSIAPTFDVLNTFFFSSGTFASSLTSAKISIFAEEFDPSGRFTRGISGDDFTIVDENPSWFSGSLTRDPAFFGFIIPIGRPIRVHLGFFYRAWVDVTAQISAAGFGGIGGSSALAQATVRVHEIEVHFIPDL